MTDDQMDALIKVLEKIEDALSDIHAELDHHNTLVEEMTMVTADGGRTLSVTGKVWTP